nr:CHASE2 domain-containing protein [uncultured Cohaesibacter sp.]
MSDSAFGRPAPVSWLRFLILIFISIFILFANPFHVLDETSSISERLAHRANAILRTQNAGDSDVIIVSIDDASIRELGKDTGYPLIFNRHSTLLTPIMCAAPSSVFIDIAFQGVRVDHEAEQTEKSALDLLSTALTQTPTSEECRKLVDLSKISPDRRSVAAPVYMARRAPEGDHCGQSGLQDNERASCSKSSFVDTLGENVHPLTLSRATEYSTQLSYPLVSNPFNNLRFDADARAFEKAQGVHAQPSPAFAMVQERCAQNIASKSEQELCRALGKEIETPVSGPLSPDRVLAPNWRYFFWETPLLSHLSQRHRDDASPDSCSSYQKVGKNGPDWWTKLRVLFWAITQDLLNQLSPFDAPLVFGQSNCSPYPNISAVTLKDLYQACSTAHNCSQLTELFAGKSVIYGYSAQAANDMIDTPVLGFVPGLMVHAAATDSLINQGKNYWRLALPERNILGFELQVDSNKISFLLVTFYLLMVIFFSRLKRGSSLAYRVGLVCLFPISIWLPQFLNLSPIDWVACFVIIWSFMPGTDEILEVAISRSCKALRLSYRFIKVKVLRST